MDKRGMRIVKFLLCDNGKENGNYHIILGLYRDNPFIGVSILFFRTASSSCLRVHPNRATIMSPQICRDQKWILGVSIT